MYIIWWSTAATDRATLFPPAACCWLLLDSETLQPGGGDGDGTIITDTGCPVYKLLLSLCILFLISDFRSFDHLLVSYPSFTYLDFHVNILKKILFPQNILSAIINEQSWQCRQQYFSLLWQCKELPFLWSIAWWELEIWEVCSIAS